MKKADVGILVGILGVILCFGLISPLFTWYKTINRNWPLLMSFFKFALLSPLGEVIGSRIKTGGYDLKQFGLIPRMIVWGCLGMAIKLAFVVFATGVPFFLEHTLEIEGAIDVMQEQITLGKIGVAFAISATMNMIFAPVMMTFHKITDTHIMAYEGKLVCLIRPLQLGEILSQLDWKTHWGFVLKKTIPFFWIPAHTITFLLPEDGQILFAAMLGIILGIILSFASRSPKKE